MTRLTGIVAGLFAAACGLVQGAEATASVGTLEPIPGLPGLTPEMLVSLEEGITRAIWEMPREMESHEDDTGHEIDRDLATLAFDDAARQRIAAARSEVMAARARGASTEEFTPLLKAWSDALLLEGRRLILVRMYWRGRDALALHRELVSALLPGLPEPEQEAARATMANLDNSLAGLRSDLDRGLPVPDATGQAANRSFTEMTTAYNRLRSELLGQLEAIRDAAGKRGDAAPPRSLERTDPCPAPVAANGRETPMLLGGPSFEAFYPLRMMQLGVEGAVVVRAHVAEDGCVRRVQVQSTSGVDAMDEASLRYALQLAYRPAGTAEKPVAADFAFRVKFELKE